MTTFDAGTRLGSWLYDASAWAAAWHPTDPRGGRRGAGLEPTNPPAPAWEPTNPPAPAWEPTNPPAAPQRADFEPTDPRALPPPGGRRYHSATRSPWGWRGIDPPWTYADADVLLGQALRRTRGKIVRPADGEDPRRTVDDDGRLLPLWRWQSKFRQRALVGDLLGRIVVRDLAMWLFEGEPGGALTVRPLLALDRRWLDSPDLHQRSNQIDKVLRAAVEREDRLPEILSQRASLWPFFEAVTGIGLDAMPRLAELLAVADSVAGHLTMVLKNQIAADRPAQVSSRVMPVISTPGHGSLPSGHATMAALLSELLVLLMFGGHDTNPRAGMLDRLARRIAFNRVVAGVHFPIDSRVGYCLGTQIARTLAALAGDRPPPAELGHREVFGSPEHPIDELPELGERLPSSAGGERVGGAEDWGRLWAEARAEIEQLPLAVRGEPT